MNPAWVWFGLMALALIGEVMTGTFYLLMVAVGFAVAGIAAWTSPGSWCCARRRWCCARCCSSA